MLVGTRKSPFVSLFVSLSLSFSSQMGLLVAFKTWIVWHVILVVKHGTRKLPYICQSNWQKEEYDWNTEKNKGWRHLTKQNKKLGTHTRQNNRICWYMRPQSTRTIFHLFRLHTRLFLQPPSFPAYILRRQKKFFCTTKNEAFYYYTVFPASKANIVGVFLFEKRFSCWPTTLAKTTHVCIILPPWLFFGQKQVSKQRSCRTCTKCKVWKNKNGIIFSLDSSEACVMACTESKSHLLWHHKCVFVFHTKLSDKFLFLSEKFGF